MQNSDIAKIMARQDIYDSLCRYCRGLDRMDKEMAYSVWHDNATAVYHGMYEGSGHGFVDWVWDAHASMERHSHQIANTLIEINGNTARSETYVTVTLWSNPDEEAQQLEIIGKGRYVDAWSKRQGRWAIKRREHVYDMETISILNRGSVSAASQRNTADPSFAAFPCFERH